MSDDKLAFLNGDKGSDTTPEPTPVSPDTSATPAQPRDESGRFAPKGETAPATPAAPSTPEPVVATPVQTPAPATPEPKHEAIPLPVFLDMRDKLKAAERRLAEAEAQRQQPQQQVPSATADPEGYAAYLETIANSTRINTRFEMSEALAREKHGDDTVQKAMDWAMEQARTSPAFAAEYLQQRLPIDWAVKQQKRHALLTAIGDDPEAYIASEIAKRQAVQAPTQPQPATPAAARPQQVAQPAPSAPRSIASAPAAGSQHHVPTGPGTAFEATFNR